MSLEVMVRVPATSANLGPGFDCLGLALDLWNQVIVRTGGQGVQVDVRGYGSQTLARDERNLVVKAFRHFYEACQLASPQGLYIFCENNIPHSSGLGSSAAAILSGLLAANALEGNPFSLSQILHLAWQMEGHADNLAAALLGGLVVVVEAEGGLITQRYEPCCMQLVVVIPQHLDFPTATARAVLPTMIPMQHAVFNMGRVTLVIEALRTGNLEMLRQAMDDRLHQPYRLKLIPGAEEALAAAQRSGAAAVISGAGPSLIAFTDGNTDGIGQEMSRAFVARSGIEPLVLTLQPGCQGAQARLVTP